MTVLFVCSASGKPTDAWPEPSLTTYVDDTIALLDHVGWSSDVRVLAISFGTAVAQELALREPQRW